MEIVPTKTEYAAALDAAVCSVAAEGVYLAGETGLGAEETRRFISDCLSGGYPQLLLVEGRSVLGWCDVVPDVKRGHGRLGIGLVRRARGLGWGERLMRATLALAFRRFRVVELCVRAENARAIALYRKLGFKAYNRRRPMPLGVFFTGRRIHMKLPRRVFYRCGAV